MKKIIVLTLLGALPTGVFAQHENHQPKVDTSMTAVKPKSPKMTAMAMIGMLTVVSKGIQDNGS